MAYRFRSALHDNSMKHLFTNDFVAIATVRHIAIALLMILMLNS